MAIALYEGRSCVEVECCIYLFWWLHGKLPKNAFEATKQSQAFLPTVIENFLNQSSKKRREDFLSRAGQCVELDHDFREAIMVQSKGVIDLSAVTGPSAMGKAGSAKLVSCSSQSLSPSSLKPPIHPR